jgi:hypothetical protein
MQAIELNLSKAAKLSVKLCLLTSDELIIPSLERASHGAND